MILEDTLKKAAYKVWDELEPVPNGKGFKIFEVREEALTTMALKEIIKCFCAEIENIQMISGSEESLKGYDFELVIGNKKKGKYVRLFIQAKRLFGKNVSSKYDSMHFGQTEDLIKYSKGNSSLAMYAFFNHIVANSLVLENHYNSVTSFDKKSMGITVASAYSVKMLQSKKFTDYHFNDGMRIDPKLYNLRYFRHLFYFHRDTKKHLAIPFHELSYFTINMAEEINKMYKKIKSSGKLNFFFLFPFGLEETFDDDLIPILNTNSEELISQFKNRTQDQTKVTVGYNPQFLLIVNTDEIEE
ncbi:DUF6615 family protein [Olleya sp. Hel_I_94]|uniref:DUF6615 family protein n=1 Tax=Olleya sp. Hel_I_94 TaxID=1250001 RepID=UPI0011A04078|nr:DUF6615 family protein [Olleya sp. Hel_I_94]TVZ47469.1 hypothetical protein JM82_2078 [Olleya sp. Hel_I_94]